MSDDPVEVVRRTHAAFLRGDYENALAAMAEDVVWDDSWFPTGGVWHGHEGVAQSIADWVETWDEYRYEPSEYRAAGDTVLVIGRQSGRNKGLDLTADNFQVWTIRNGKATHVRLFGDRADAFRAAGVDP
jgi:ketosteroid isomerase-like protein